MTKTSNAIGKKIPSLIPRNKWKGIGQRSDVVNDYPQSPMWTTLVQNGIKDNLGISFNTHLLTTLDHCKSQSIIKRKSFNNKNGTFSKIVGTDHNRWTIIIFYDKSSSSLWTHCRAIKTNFEFRSMTWSSLGSLRWCISCTLSITLNFNQKYFNNLI